MGTVYNPNEGAGTAFVRVGNQFVQAVRDNPLGALYAASNLYKGAGKIYENASDGYNSFTKSNKRQKSTEAQKFASTSKRFVNPNTRTGGWPTQPCQLEKELKYIDHTIAGTTITNSLALFNPSSQNWVGIPQGSGASQRIGKHVCLYSIEFNYMIHLTPIVTGKQS